MADAYYGIDDGHGNQLTASSDVVCEACNVGMRRADDGLHYDDARGGWTWGVCRKVVARIRAEREPQNASDED